ncbi:MAG: hypothetical protein LQ346_001525 [Caloplaca aetnensis]|nr:MAG: hypothetical protein LQ346_001525 [Caloplaca aetnensis]
MPFYRTLSYTWGPPTRLAEEKGMTDQRCCPIVCNGRTLLVTENLLLCLRRVSSWETWETRVLPWWIDAICINQEDVLERSEQVRKMADIYAAALITTVWLGEEDEHTAPAMELLDALEPVELQELKRIDPLALYDETEEQCRQELGFSIDPRAWTALSWLYKGRFFRRVWVLQECALSMAKMWICGSRLINPDKLLDVSDYLLSSPWSGVRGFNSVGETPSALAMHPASYTTLLLRSMMDQGQTYGSRLRTALVYGRMCESTDPRDKVYAMIGFFEGSDEKRRSYSILSPDYTKSVGQIYLEATDFLLNDSEDLLVLSMVNDRRHRKLKGLPSWVPDFSVPFMTGFGLLERNVYCASRTLKPDWDIIHGGMVLRLRASRLDSISRIGESKFDMINRQCHQTLSMLADMDDAYVTGQNKKEALCRTLIGDPDRGGTPRQPQNRSATPSSLETSFRSWLLHYSALWLRAAKESGDRYHFILAQLAALSDNRTFPQVEEILQLAERLELGYGQTAALTKAAMPYEDAFRKVYDARVFRTHKSFMGLGPLSLEAGDSIWLIPGSEVLFVLREKPETNRFELIGDCYVHGLMRGEAVDGALPKMETIELE